MYQKVSSIAVLQVIFNVFFPELCIYKITYRRFMLFVVRA